MLRAICVMMCVAGSAAGAEPVLGLWKTALQEDGAFGFVQIAPCGDNLCGILVEGVNAAGVSAKEGGHIGRKIIWDMVAQGDGHYGGGKIWSPDRDRTYQADMTLAGDALKIRGCLLGICRDGGTWVRVN